MQDINILIHDFLDQVNYAMSSKFKDKWKHRFSASFISTFQEHLLKALKDQKPIKKSTLISLYTKRLKYSTFTVEDFFKCIDLNLYYPLIYEDRRYLLKK